MYKVGDRVLIIDRNNVAGTITAIEKYGDIEFFEIMLDSSALISTTIGNIRPYKNITSPLDLFSQANFQSKDVFAVGSTLNKIISNSTDIIATLKSSRTNFLPYQFKPLLKFFRSENRRILIADEVGLGKTIEAGYILAELSLRKSINNCLIICKSSLKNKWQEELKTKFGYNFEIYKLQDLKKELQKENGENVFGIINYDYNKKISNEFLELLEDKELQFDMLIIDEAHILRNAETIKHDAAKRLIKLSKNTILLTATPIMTSIINLYNLIKIIEPKYEDYQYGSNSDYGYGLFMDHLSLSRPFIEASNKLNNGISPKEIIQELIKERIDLRIHLKEGGYSYSTTITIGERFESDPLFNEVIKLSHKSPFDNKDFVKLQSFLSELNSFHDIISRTRKREIQTEVQQIVRNAQKCAVRFNSTEEEFYQSIIEDYDGEPLALVQRKREATSCLPAYIDKHNIVTHEANEIKNNDSKFREFKKILDAVVLNKGKKLIVFSFFKGTLSYLEKRLRAVHIYTAKIDGDTPINNRQGVINDFRNKEEIKVLLSSEVGSEGLDMQFCDALVNYDLPWNPMVVEQRIGRIDRIGQKSQVIYIYNLCIQDSIEDQIYKRLFDRIQIFTKAIGSLEDILTTDEGVFEIGNNLENQIYGHQLNLTAKESLLVAAERAIEKAKLLCGEIEEDLDSSFLNDLYINNEIKNINRQKKYLTEVDIKAILNLLFQTRLNTVRCNLDADNPYINIDRKSSLFDFVKDNLPDTRPASQVRSAYRDFRNKNENSDKIYCTFQQTAASSTEQSNLEFISATHPLIQATLHHFKKKNTATNNAFCFCIDSEHAKKIGNKDTFFILAKYQMKTLKSTTGNEHESYSELPLLFKINESEEFELMSQDITNELLEIDITDWYENPESPTMEECEEFIKKLRPVLMASIHANKKKMETEQKNIHISRYYRLIDTEINFLTRQIEKDTKTIDNDPENTIRFILAKRIREYEDKIATLQNQKNAINLKINESLQSLTLIQIV